MVKSAEKIEKARMMDYESVSITFPHIRNRSIEATTYIVHSVWNSKSLSYSEESKFNVKRATFRPSMGLEVWLVNHRAWMTNCTKYGLLV